jgi:hypothetical protein
MKKICCSIVIGLLLVSCHTNYFSDFGAGMNYISQCCSNNKLTSTPTLETAASLEEKEKDQLDIIAPLPAYIWDTKMIIW